MGIFLKAPLQKDRPQLRNKSCSAKPLPYSENNLDSNCYRDTNMNEFSNVRQQTIEAADENNKDANTTHHIDFLNFAASAEPPVVLPSS